MPTYAVTHFFYSIYCRAIVEWE